LNISEINDRLQLAATVGVIIGLGLVVYEIRENNAIAYQQAVSGSWQNWTDLSGAQLQSDIADIFAKSMTNPDDVTLAETVKLGFWLGAHMNAWEQDLRTVKLSGGDPTGWVTAMSKDAAWYFGNKITRGWYSENKYWLSPEYVQAIDQALEKYPLGSDLESFERIMGREP
jgi:hypothetical protein